jgi:hypothetical protein
MSEYELVAVISAIIYSGLVSYVGDDDEPHTKEETVKFSVEVAHDILRETNRQVLVDHSAFPNPT